jgi:hypothetical protein
MVITRQQAAALGAGLVASNSQHFKELFLYREVCRWRNHRACIRVETEYEFAIYLHATVILKIPSRRNS